LRFVAQELPMDADRFDRLARWLTTPRPRRAVGRLALAGLLAMVPVRPGAADRRPRKYDTRRKCLALGQPCNWRRPSECCSSSCQLPWYTGRGTDIFWHPKPHEVTVCVEVAFGCTARRNTCPPTGEIEQHSCPGIPTASCLVNVDGRPFCGNLGGACERCDSDEDCVRLHQPGSHCIECEARCHDPGVKHHRACVGEGSPPQ
jgi:hypothetical protein